MAGIQMLPRKALHAGMLKGRCAAPVFTATHSGDYAQMSTRQASRAEMLKSRFAETILKARLELIQGVNKSEKTPSQIKLSAGAAAASRTAEQYNLQIRRDLEERKPARMALEKARHSERPARLELEKARQRERQRKAARMALQKMRKTVEVDKSAESILKDLEILFGQPVQTGYPDAKQLEKLGLYMKEDTYWEEDEDTNMELEEGEIPS